MKSKLIIATTVSFVFSCLSSPIANFTALAESPMSDTIATIEICNYTNPDDYKAVMGEKSRIPTSYLIDIGFDLGKQNDNSCYMYIVAGKLDYYITAYKIFVGGKLQNMVRYSTPDEISYANPKSNATNIPFKKISKSGVYRGILAQGD